MANSGEGASWGEKNGTVVYRSTVDLEETELSTAILIGLDSVPGYDVENSDTVVFDHIDLDALDELFISAGIDEPQGRITFPIEEYRVTATAAGEIIIRI